MGKTDRFILSGDLSLWSFFLACRLLSLTVRLMYRQKALSALRHWDVKAEKVMNVWKKNDTLLFHLLKRGTVACIDVICEMISNWTEFPFILLAVTIKLYIYYCFKVLSINLHFFVFLIHTYAYFEKFLYRAYGNYVRYIFEWFYPLLYVYASENLVSVNSQRSDYFSHPPNALIPSLYKNIGLINEGIDLCDHISRPLVFTYKFI